MQWKGVVSAAIVAVSVAALPAWAHGEFESSEPAADSTVRRAPESVSITLTEAPGPGTTVRVSDGCHENIVVASSRSGEVLEATLKGGQPGHWKVSFQAVSAVDGHTTRGSLGFEVRGRRDCSPHGKGSPSPDEVGGGAGTRIENPDPPDEGTTFPVVPFAVGSVIVIGLAFIVRRIAAG